MVEKQHSNSNVTDPNESWYLSRDQRRTLLELAVRKMFVPIVINWKSKTSLLAFIPDKNRQGTMLSTPGLPENNQVLKVEIPEGVNVYLKPLVYQKYLLQARIVENAIAKLTRQSPGTTFYPLILVTPSDVGESAVVDPTSLTGQVLTSNGQDWSRTTPESNESSQHSNGQTKLPGDINVFSVNDFAN